MQMMSKGELQRLDHQALVLVNRTKVRQECPKKVLQRGSRLTIKTVRTRSQIRTGAGERRDGSLLPGGRSRSLLGYDHHVSSLSLSRVWSVLSAVRNFFTHLFFLSVSRYAEDR